MYQRLLYTIAIAVSLTGLYAIYSVAMQTVVVIPIRSEQPIEEDSNREPQWPAENVRIAKTFIPHRKWAEKSSYMLRSEQAFIYTRHWEPVPDNNRRIRFEKFAMAWTSVNSDGEDQAVTIVSDYALLEFASEFNEKANMGRVVRAVLEGDVEIQGPDGLCVVGRNFIFDEAELNLFTPSPVTFRYQSHQGSASRMSMKLIAALGIPGKDRPHIYGVQSIHLIANPSLPKNSHVNLEIQMPQGDDSKTVKVKCAGDMEYSVITNTAVLTKDVRAWMVNDDKTIDLLDCYKLTMLFVPKKYPIDQQKVKTKTDQEKRREAEYQHVERDLEFSSMVAESRYEAESRHGQMVVIDLKSQKVKAMMGLLSYSAASKVITMNTREVKPKSENQKPFVYVAQRGSDLKVPTVELLVPLISIQLGTSPTGQTSLETLLCLGAGNLKFFNDKTGDLAFIATWQKQLLKRTDAETKLDLVELEQSAHFGTADETTGLIAEMIRIWLEPINVSSPGNGSGRPGETPQPEPKRLLAQNGVGLKSPQLRIRRTNELDIRFVDSHAATGNALSEKPRSELQAASLSNVENRPVGFANIPTVVENSRGSRVPPPTDREPISSTKTNQQLVKPIIVSADQIGVSMRRVAGKQEPEVLAVHANGKVDISQEQAPGEKPTTLEGDRIDLQNHSANQQVVDVFGSPAKIRDPRFRIEGKEIHLDRGGNRAWVAGSGRLTIPIPENIKILGLETAPTRDLSVLWDDSMNFDGLDADFIGRVQAKLGWASMECEQMKLQLLDKFAFQAVDADMKPALRLIECSERVKFKNATYSEKKLIDRYRGEVSEFTWNHATGEVVAQGPGEIQVWRRQTTVGSPFSPRDTIQANRPIPVEIAEWDYTSVQFEGKLKGRIDGSNSGVSDRQSVTVGDRVKVTHGPVIKPTEMVNPDELPSKSGTIHCDKLEFVNYVAKNNQPEYRHLIGSGNAEIEGQVEGRRFTASADEISFDGSKGLYVLRGHGKHNARLTQIGSIDGSGSIPGRRIEFNPTTRYLNVDGASGGQFSQLR